MAKARMLHKKISISQQMELLSLPAQLLFTWMISHADDDGRLRGETRYVKASVVPLKDWSVKKIGDYLQEMVIAELIHLWSQNGETYIEFIKWRDHQYIRKDRHIPSSLPHFYGDFDNTKELARLPDVNQASAQYNEIKFNEIQSNKSEYNKNTSHFSYKEEIDELSTETIIPKNFVPSTEGQAAAQRACVALEPFNSQAMRTTYLSALDKGLPLHLFDQFVSEILQDHTVKNKGAVFNKKVTEYFDKQREDV